MNDPFGNISSPVPSSAGQSLGNKAQIVQIVKLPESLKVTDRSLRIEGQITQINKNGTISIETEKGNIEVKVNGKKASKIGQRLEIEIPAGRPARQASIKNAPIIPTPPDSAKIRATYDGPVQARAQVSSTAPDAPRNPVQLDPQQKGVPPRAQRQTSLPPTIQETAGQAKTLTNTGQQSIPLTKEAIVRLLAIAPAQAQSIATETAQNLPTPQANILSRVALSSNITAQNVQNQQANTLLQAIPPAKTNAPVTTQQITTPNILTRNIQNAIQQSTGQQIQNIALFPATKTVNNNFTILQPTPITSAIPATHTLPSNIATQFLQLQNAQTTTPAPALPTPQTATLIPTAITFDPTNPSTIIQPRVAQLDIQIIKITQPIAVLKAPAITAQTTPITPQQIIPAATQFIPPLTSTNNAVSLTAQVTGFTAQNLPLVTVKWPGVPLPQSFILQQSTSNLQLGSQIQIIPKIAPISAQAITALPKLGTQNPLLQGFQWPALNDLYNTLQQLSPQAAASLSRALPNAGNPAQTGTAAMMFIAAIRSGDIGAWLGDKKMDLLQQTQKMELLSRLTQKSSTATARAPVAEQSTSSDWRAVPMPMFWEGEIHKITLYTRNEEQSNQQDNQKNKGRTRFVFDLSLSRMGDIQLDGLLRDNRLDLVLRAQNNFSLPMQQTMRQAYSSALDHTDLTGELTFQGDTKNWVHVLQEKEQLGVDV